MMDAWQNNWFYILISIWIMVIVMLDGWWLDIRLEMTSRLGTAMNSGYYSRTDLQTAQNLVTVPC
jgi:hypothetical protein